MFGKVNLNSCCIPIFQSLASTVAEIHRGSQIFLCASLAQTPANFGPKRRFFGKLAPNTICVLNLKLLASTVAEIVEVPIFWMLPQPRPPPILVINVVFW